MKKLLTLLALICTLTVLRSQTPDILSIEESYRLAEENFPMTKQRELIARSEAYSVSNAAKGLLPSFTINGQQSYQSDVTSIPTPNPDMSIPLLSKNQYKVYGEVAANLYDGGAVRNQKESHRAQAKVDGQKLEVELYKLRDRINQLFFGILLLDAQLAQNELLKNDIQRGITRIQAGIANGTSLKSGADVLQAEYLKTNQRSIELQSSRNAFIEMLSLMLGKPLDDATRFQKPQPLAAPPDVRRPELRLYDYQRDAYHVQHKMLATRNRPKVSLFFQGGYGRPALDMLKNKPEAYYVTGVRLNWTISGLYTYKKEKALLNMSQTSLDIQKQTFLYNTDLSLKNQKGEVSKLQNVLASDDEIIALREKIKNTASAQLANGIITSNDYLREVTAEDQARQNKILHEIQLLVAQYNMQNIAGI